MPNLSLRGLDAATLARIKSRAWRRGVRVNRLILETLQREYAAGNRTYDDLNALVGRWTKAQADEFTSAVAAFGEIEPALWAGEQKTDYRAPPRAGRSRRR
ncbi:MAG: hypothetical protein ACT4P4_02750 [Betaproteobacteria bacterium]